MHTVSGSHQVCGCSLLLLHRLTDGLSCLSWIGFGLILPDLQNLRVEPVIRTIPNLPDILDADPDDTAEFAFQLRIKRLTENGVDASFPFHEVTACRL